MILKRIENWLIHSQKYFFTYSEGFFNLSYIMNSPNAMIQSMEYLPFMKHNKAIQKIYTNNPFCEGDIYYHDIEEGLILLLTDVSFKANIKINLIYDKFIPIEHYNLVLHLDQTKFPPNQIIKNVLNYQNNFWTFIKPGSIDADYHLKGSHGKYVSLHFTEKWIKSNLQSEENLKLFNEFLASKNNYNIWSDNTLNLGQYYDEFLMLITNNESSGNANTLKLKLKTYGFLDLFFSNILPKLNQKITNSSEFQKMLIAEKLLLENMTDFIGIENLALKLKISETKLKSDFKNAFGNTIYKHYKEKQMVVAKEYLKKADIKVKDVAVLLGYENPSKFTIAYKKQFGVLPSKIE